MKANRFLEKITENWRAKTICFVMALLIYMFHQISTLDKKTVTIPLAVVAEGAMCPMSSTPQFVKVTVRAKAEAISMIQAGEITAELNLNTYAKSGKYEVPVRLDISPDLMLMDPLELSVHPEYVPVALEEKTEKFVKVTPLIAGEPAHGYSVKNVAVSPSTVKISGPRSIVENTKEIYTGKVDVADRESGSTVVTGIESSNLLVEPDDPSLQVSVSYTVAPEPMTKKFTDVPIHAMFLAPKLEVEEALPLVSFELDGTVSILEKYEPDENTVQIDCSEIQEPGSYDLPVQFVLPSSVQVIDKSIDTIKVHIKLRTEEKNSEPVNGLQ